MYPISSAIKALFEAEQVQVLRITGTDRNGAVISITDENVVQGGFSIDRYSCNGEKLEIGTAVSAEMTLKLDNIDGAFDSIVFEGAELFVEIGIADWSQENPTITYIPCGYFTPDRQPRRLTTITLNALDRMTRFDVVLINETPWTDEYGNVVVDENGNVIVFAALFQFPCTVANLVEQVCEMCYVPFTQDITELPNADFELTELPDIQQTITLRNIIQWCAGIMGTNAWIDWNGNLIFSFYGAETGYVSTTVNRYSSDIYEDDITITGVSYTNTQGVTLTSGLATYALDMTGNYLMAAGVAEILQNVNAEINGFTYRPFEAHVVNAPYLWPMDMITYTDKDGNDHICAVTNVNFGINGTTALAGRGETAQSNTMASGSGMTTEQAFLVESAVKATEDVIDESLTQEEIFNRLTDNGQNQALILYNGQLYLNASYINTGTMSATYIKGGIMTLGGNGNINGQLVIKDANNNTIGTWNASGITILEGSLSASIINGGTLTLGGTNNTEGQLEVKDASNNTIGTWNNQGISLNSGSIGDAAGKSSWNLDTGAFSINGTITTIGTDQSGNEYKTEMENGILTFSMREDSEDPWTDLVSIGIRNAFIAGLMPVNQSGNVALNATLENNGEIEGGSYVSADTSGEIDLRGSGIKVGPLDPQDPAYLLGGYDGYTGTVQIITGVDFSTQTTTASTIEIVNGLIVDVT